MTTIDRLREIRERANKATAGPWLWRRMSETVSLVCPHKGMLLILDAVRMGMNRATLRFGVRTATDKGGIMRTVDELVPYEPRGSDYPEVTNPDMAFIAAARSDVPKLCDVAEEFLAAFASQFNGDESDPQWVQDVLAAAMDKLK